MNDLKIIIVEDDLELAKIVQFKLGKEGFQIIHEADGQKGLEMILALVPDLVILDVMLPGFNGFQILETIRQNENTKKIREFVGELQKEIDAPVDFVDERFTSAQADSMGGTVSRDEKAAMLILQSYLDKDK